MLFNQVEAILKNRAELLKTIKIILKEVDTTDGNSVTLFMDYVSNEDTITQTMIFKEANWVMNKPLYEACIKYDLERFKQVSIGLKSFIENNMRNFVINNLIYEKELSFGGNTRYIHPALDALETAFWLGVTSADL